MRRADRLFKIIDVLRTKSLVTARELADRFEVSERTIYRDVQHLVMSGVPIAGEAGVGYMLRGFELPPLTFSQEEIDALRLGARIVASWADSDLARASRDAITKIEAAMPSEAQRSLKESDLFAPEWHFQEPIQIDVAELRRALREKRRVRLDYRSGKGETSTRTVLPLALTFYGPVWMLVAWCELRDFFRTFRLDRASDMTIGEPFELLEHQTLGAFLEEMRRSEAEFAKRQDPEFAKREEAEFAKREEPGESCG